VRNKVCFGIFDCNYMSIGVEPKLMGIGPVAAIPKVLAQTGLNKESVDVWEVRIGYDTCDLLCNLSLCIRSMRLSHPNLHTA
jgi:acetyl-CoA acetyltransferase